MKSTTAQTVNRYIESHQLLDKNDRCIVALSGGADSVALLLVLKELGYAVEAAHCNFHLRGDESDRDENFVANLCQQQGVELHRAHFDTKAYASLHKVSIEMAARELRYAYFEQLRRDTGAEAIGVAHHREDSVETMLINLLRGTGLHGLTGISPRNGHIVRPLLCLSRNDIEQYLAEKGQPFVTDSTNLVDDVTRNKIRLDIMPLLRQINPNADMSMQQTAERMGEAAKVFDNAIRHAIDNTTSRHGDSLIIDIAKLMRQASPEYTLHETLKPLGFSAQTTEMIFRNIGAHTGRTFTSTTHDLAFDRGRMVIEKRRPEAKAMRLPEPGRYVMGDGATLTAELRDTAEVSKDALVATLDAATVAFPLYIRKVESGDRFTPFGMKGSKLVSDFLTDRKKNVLEKRAQLVVADGNGRIVWVVGERTCNECRVSGATLQTLRLRYEPASARS